MSPLLSADRITPLLRHAAGHIDIEVVARTGSTNADLLQRLPALGRPLLLAAVEQTAGRGRAGRSWLSSAEASLTFSLAWKFEMPLQRLVGLPLAVGVALARALGLHGTPVQLKWPNDVLHDGAKLAGILIETGSPAAGANLDACWAVIGIGINLAGAAELGARLQREVAALPAPAQIDRNVLLATLADCLAQALAQFGAEGLASFVADWNALHAHANQPVVILDGERVLHQGIARGIDSSGCLLLQTETGPVAVMAGDVSLRAKPAREEN